jgi:glycosyltransferase involved in cell wall biosynthesis
MSEAPAQRPAAATDDPASAAEPRLSVVVITRNEAHNLADCLASVAFADEIVVLDSGSTDATLAIAERAGARAVQGGADWPGFGAQKNRALALARGRFVLSIDADERVSAPLRAEIERLLASAAARPSENDAVAWRMPRLSSFCGRFMRHGGWHPDPVLRLFRRGFARFSDDAVHETLLLLPPWNARAAATGTLRAPLIHFSYDRLDQVLDKLNRYSSGRAADLAARGRRGGLWRALAHGGWTFVRLYLLRLGMLDGSHGFVAALYQAETTYYRYLKLDARFDRRPDIPAHLRPDGEHR